MTREEAIYLLRNTAWLAPSGNYESVEEAVDMATKALERTSNAPNAHPTHECVESTHECVELISRGEALNLVLDVCNDVMDECETVTGICGEEVYTDVREVDAILKCNKRIRNGIRWLPSAQSEIIRCKNCKHLQKWRSEESAKKFGQSYTCARNVLYCPKPDDFCSYGERREEDEK